MARDVKKFLKFYKSELGRKIADKEASYLRGKLKTGERVLDIGCGIGWLEERLQDFNIVGVDSSREMLKEARKRSDKTFVRGEAENLGFKDGSFDVVIFITTLEFLPDYRKAVRESYRVLKPKGKLLAMIINPESEYFKGHVKKKGSYFRRIKHTNLKEIENYMSKYFSIRARYFLGIKDRVFDTSDEKLASLYVINGSRR